MNVTKKPWECDNKLEKAIVLNEYADDFEVLTKTLEVSPEINIKARAFLLAKNLKPMDEDQMINYLIDCGLSYDEIKAVLKESRRLLENL